MKLSKYKDLLEWRDSIRPINKNVAAGLKTNEPYQNSKARRTALWRSKQ
jgi:hypothetical protein